jgi:hypothetical protein
MYKPYGKNVKSYDVNSLYPSQMLAQDMPVGKPIYFDGDIFETNSNPFGFFEVEVEAPDNLIYPILQTKVKTNNGYRTITPIGN